MNVEIGQVFLPTERAFLAVEPPIDVARTHHTAEVESNEASALSAETEEELSDFSLENLDLIEEEHTYFGKVLKDY